MIVYAVGDIHGRDDLLARIHEQIIEDRKQRHADDTAIIVHVGDYVDRGPNSLAVIDRLMRGVEGFEVICLKGNHEAMLLDCTQSHDRGTWQMWCGNGGVATLQSLGLPSMLGPTEPRDLERRVGGSRLRWLRSLPLSYQWQDILFVHAGIRPGVPLEQQRETDLLWIRDSFLECEDDHGVLVIHGHTPMEAPDIRFNRIGIDTGAVFTNRLTAVVLGEADQPRFLVTE